MKKSVDKSNWKLKILGTIAKKAERRAAVYSKSKKLSQAKSDFRYISYRLNQLYFID